MKLNKEWHEHHPMPKNPTLEQRIQWHVSMQRLAGAGKFRSPF
ncbi:MAG TPA: hypothetical protein VIU12_27355 [Chryseolinea sp.]